MGEKVLVTPTDVSNLTNSGASVLIDTRDPAVYAFPTPREAAAAITMARPWVARMTPQDTARTASAAVPPMPLARADEVIE